MKISAYIPCYNSRNTIREAVQSIENQTIKPDEIFIVDDGSTDQPSEVAGVPTLSLPENGGRGNARARAMKRAQYELVLACDATLKLNIEFAERALPWFKNNQVAAVFGWVKDEALSTPANRWRRRHLFRSRLERQVIHQKMLETGGCLVRKSAVEKVGGFDSRLRSGEDADLGKRLLTAGFDVIFDPALFATTEKSDTALQVLERYARWHSECGMSVKDYLIQIYYSTKVLMVRDLKAKDPLAAGLSILSPHYQLWWSRKTFGN